MGFVLQTVVETPSVNLPSRLKIYAKNEALLNFLSWLLKYYAREVPVYACDVCKRGEEEYHRTFRSNCPDQRYRDEESPRGVGGRGGR